MKFILRLLCLCAAASLLLAACNSTATPPAPTLPAATATQPQPSATPAPPTPTPQPLAARINCEGILLSEYQAERQRLAAALVELKTELPAAEQHTRVINELIDQVLLAQAAVKAGQKVEDAALEKRITDLTAQIGGAEKLADWMGRNFYTPESLRTMLRRAMLGTWQRDQVTAAVPATADQVHARQIRLSTQTEADKVLKQLQAGMDFATLALNYDPLTGGDLGWFPRNYLAQPDVETAAFDLETGKFSAIIKTPIGYHIVHVIDHQASYPLSSSARLALQQQALEKWLKDRRAQSSIEILAAP